MSKVTQALHRLEQGDPGAADQLLRLVYDELRRLAAAKMAGEAPGQTLQPTALVHEAWLRLGGETQPHWQNRAHFFAAAAEAMRRIVVEAARRRGRMKRGRGAEVLPLDTAALEIPGSAPDQEVLAVHEALGQLAAGDPAAAEVVKLRYFLGLPIPQVAEVLQVSPRSADRLWAYARARLKQVIRGERD